MKKFLVSMLTLSALVSGCGSSSNDSEQTPTPPPPPVQESASFEVTVTNASNAQPFSPLAVILHADGFATFSIGQSASTELEMLAESGDNSTMLSMADSNADVFSTASGAGILMPGMSETINISASGDAPLDLRLTVLTMPVNTNDAFTGGNSIDLNALEAGQQIRWVGRAYDAGTEANSEAVTDIPGPAAGGEGFNAARDDRQDVVSMHAGVVTGDDGLATSILTNQHRFLNPIATFTVLRTQ